MWSAMVRQGTGSAYDGVSEAVARVVALVVRVVVLVVRAVALVARVVALVVKEDAVEDRAVVVMAAVVVRATGLTPSWPSRRRRLPMTSN